MPEGLDGVGLPAGVWDAAVEAVSAAELVLVVGTSALVYPAAQLVPLAARARARVIEINIEETPASTHAGICPRGPSGEILPNLLSDA